MKARDLLFYNTSDKKVSVSVYFQNGTFWLTQKAMAELFGVNVPAVSKHLTNIFEAGELSKESTVSILEIVRLEDETVWLTQDQMATLFGKGRSTITEHIGNVFDEGEEQNRIE